MESATVPCIETGTGICHVYVDRDADLNMAVKIIENAKTSRPSVCNAEEVCLVHRDIAKEFLPKLKSALTRISSAENGKCLIVLKSTRYLSYMTLLREQNAELIISAYDGLRVPKNALRVDENGVSGVYCLVGRVAYFKPVSIVYQGSDYCLVEPGTIEAATESQKSLYTLRPNDEVIVSAGELYNGKVVD